MKASNILTGIVAVALVAGCAQENDFVPERETEGDGAKVYSFTATAEDPITRAFFKEEEAPSRFIYWDDDDEFDFHDIEMVEDGEKVSVSSSKPTSMGVSKKSVLFEKSAHDFMVITYPKGAVSLVDTVALNYVSTKETDTLRFASNTLVKVSVPKVQELSSVLTPDNLPMASFRMALSDRAKAAVKDGKDTVSADFQNPVKMFPLAGLVKMTITGLPGVTSATVTKVNILSEFDAKTSTGLPQRGLRGDNIVSLKDTMAVVGNWTSGDARFDVSLYGKNTLPYTAEKGTDVCFVTNHSMAGMKTLLVVVYTSDGAVYRKTFDTSKRQIGFSKSRITSFTLDFTNGSVTKEASKKFSVEWSKGYLVYDADNKAYKIGDKQDIGLYFKFGCPDAIALYESNKDWLDRIRPANLVDQEIGGTGGKTQEVTPDGQTLKNGTCNFYSGMPAMATAWRTRTFYKVSGTTVTPVEMKSENDYLDWNGSTDFTGANDPCSLVKVASGEKTWRLPTYKEFEELIEVGAPGVEFGNFDGSDIKSNDGKSRYVKYSDGEQEFYLMANGYAKTSISTAYSQIQVIYGSKYSVNLFNSDYVGTEKPQAVAKNYTYLFTFSLSSSPTITTKASLTTKVNANSNNNNSGTRTLWDAVNVRCVRDK